eukprot:2698573-Rhodomonas_salina.1
MPTCQCLQAYTRTDACTLARARMSAGLPIRSQTRYTFFLFFFLSETQIQDAASLCPSSRDAEMSECWGMVVEVRSPAICLRASYAMPGTQTNYLLRYV